MKTRNYFLLMALCLAPASLSVSHAELVDEDLSNCRGLNFNVPGASNPVEQWLDYDGPMVEQSLETLATFGVNGIRVFGSYAVWKEYPGRYRMRLEHMAREAFEHDMLFMIILFDSIGKFPADGTCLTGPSPAVCGDAAGACADAMCPGWVKSPGNEVLDPQFLTNASPYVADTISAIESAKNGLPALPSGKAPRVIYDIWNEPSRPIVDEGPPVVFGPLPWAEIDAVLAMIDQASTDWTTVGLTGAGVNFEMFANIANDHLVDVISHHPYVHFEASFEAEAATARSAATVGLSPGEERPIVASEVVHHAAGQGAVHVLGWLAEEQEGFFAWEAFVSENIFATVSGLFYPEAMTSTDAIVRDLEGVNKFVQLADDQAGPAGFVPARVARLKLPGAPGEVLYEPADYDFTTPKAHSLLLDWDYEVAQVYGPITTHVLQEHIYYAPLVFTGATSAIVAPQSLFGCVTGIPPDCETGFEWLQTKWDELALAAIFENELAIEAIYSEVANYFAPFFTGLEAPTNTPPDVAYVSVSPNPYTGGQSLVVETVVNDGDRIEDPALGIDFVQVGVLLPDIPAWIVLDPDVQHMGDGYYVYDAGVFLPPQSVPATIAVAVFDKAGAGAVKTKEAP